MCRRSRLDAILGFDRRAGTASAFPIPTMIVCADDDIITPRYFSEDFAARIPNARAHYETRGGHALSRTEPDLFNKLVTDFFLERIHEHSFCTLLAALLSAAAPATGFAQEVGRPAIFASSCRSRLVAVPTRRPA